MTYSFRVTHQDPSDEEGGQEFLREDSENTGFPRATGFLKATKHIRKYELKTDIHASSC